MNKKYRLANFSLFIVFLGFLVAYPFSNSFYGGLIFSGFCAALIGGLADWFAVTALFRKPLHIPSMNVGFKEPIIRTEIIPRNREKVMDTLRYMINEELLTKDMLKGKIEQVDIVNIGVNIYKKEKESINEGLSSAIEQMLHVLNEDEIAGLFQTIVNKEGNRISLSDFLYKVLMYGKQNRYDEQWLTFFLKVGKELIETEEVRLILVELIDNVRHSYSEGNSARRVATTILFEQILKTSSNELSKEIQQYLSKLLKKMIEEETHPYRLLINEKIDIFTIQLKTNEKVRTTIEQWKQQQLESPFIMDSILRIIGPNFEQGQRERYIKKVLSRFEHYIAGLQQNKVEREVINDYIKNIGMQLIEKQHKKIDTLIISKLNSFTDEEFVDLIEKKAGNDLQMIRINGTVVGGLVGIVFYLLTNLL